MKYLLVLSWMGLGGSERQAINLAEYILGMGDDVTILGLCESGRVNEICDEHGIRSDILPPRNSLYSICYKLLHRLGIRRLTAEEIALLGQIHDLGRYILHGGYDVCLSYCTTANIVLGHVKIAHPELTCIWRQGDAGIYDHMEGLQVPSVAAVDAIISNGITPHDWIKRAYGRDSHIIYNGVYTALPQKSRNDWREELQLADTDIVCTMIANLTAAKNHMFLLEVWNELIKRGEEYKLVCAGIHASEYIKLTEYAGSNGLTSCVRFPGHVVDVYGLIQATDICVFAAKSEGSPNGIIECCINGLPVVANDLPEIREIVAEDNLPYLFESGDINQAADMIQSLASDTGLRHRLGDLNRSKAIRMFDPESNYRQVVDLCRNVREGHE